jgi:cell division protein FtsI (penicillin-binding protein 3)
MILLAVIVVFRLIYIQFVQGDMWAERAVGIKSGVVEATRGNIYADDGSFLATSIPFFKVALDMAVMKDTTFENNVDSLAFYLANYFQDKTDKEYADELRAARAEKKRFKLLNKKLIDYQTYLKFQKFPIFRLGKKESGAIFEKTEIRFQPYGDLAKRTLGFVYGEDGDTLSGSRVGRGLELSFNKQLAGINGEAIFQRMPGGYWIPTEDLMQIRPENGLDIQTTIDIHLQDTIHKILNRTLVETEANYGCAIVMETKTGEIKAIVNLGRNKDGTYSENNNFAVGEVGMEEPGSTFKLASMMAVLEEGKVSPTDTVDTGNGKYKFFDDAVMTDVYANGKISAEDVIVKSSNVGMSRIVFKTFRKEPEKFIGYLEKFGLTKPVEFQMLGEAHPYVKRPGDKFWSGSSLPWMSIGYELKLAPIHTLTFYNAIANKGKLISPLIVRHASQAGKIKEKYEAKTLNPKICSEKNAEILTQMLVKAVEKGTAKNIATNAYKIAGKTGTSEKVKDGSYSEEHYTSFVGFFPADNPRFTCIVVVDKPKMNDGARYGGQVAAPVFRKIADLMYYRYIMKDLEETPKNTEKTLPVIRAGFKPDLELICKTLNIYNQSSTSENWVRTSVSGDTVTWVGLGHMPDYVPNVLGMRLRDALYLLENNGYKVSISGYGRVKSQSVAAGTKLKRGAKVHIELE